MNTANLKTNMGGRKLGKCFLIAGIISAVVIIILISTGLVTWNDLIQMYFKLIKICPFCM